MDMLKQLALDFGVTFTTTELILYLMVCVLAISMGVFLAKKQAQAFSGQSHGAHPAVTFVDHGDMRFLHLGSPAVQGSMQISKPFDIHLEYQQRMMAWLLFTPLEQLNRLQVMQMGLGAASLTKFCHHHLNTHTTAIELNPQVIDTCRQWFKLPANNDTLQVVLADAAQTARDAQWQEKIDVLQIDLYDAQAACPVLDSAMFYADCRKMLTHDGRMVVNIYGRASNINNSLEKMASSFGNDALWVFKPTSAGNSIVLAFRSPRLLEKNTLQAQAQRIESRWSLPATKWLKVLAPLQ